MPPSRAHNLLRYARVLAMIDDEKARITGTRMVNEREYLTIQTIAGEVFEIVRPEISEEVEAELMEQVRSIVAEEESEDGR